MGDLKLFQVEGSNSHEIPARFALLERNLQLLIEQHMEKLLGIRLLAHEYPTGRPHKGFVDTLGLDENNCPVIIEYKRYNNENIICQGLFYLDWVMTHKADFRQLVKERFEENINIEFAGTRLICIASSYSRYDEMAIMQIDRNIELVKYKFFGENLLLLEVLNTSLQKLLPENAILAVDSNGNEEREIGMPVSLQERVRNMNPEIEDMYLEALSFAENLGDDVSIKFLKHYIALTRLKNFACLQPMKNALKFWLNMDPGSIELEEGFSRDVTTLGHHASGNLEIEVKNQDGWQKCQKLLEMAYQQNG